MPSEKLKNEIINIESEVKSLEKQIKSLDNICFNLDHLQALYFEIGTLFSKTVENRSTENSITPTPKVKVSHNKIGKIQIKELGNIKTNKSVEQQKEIKQFNSKKFINEIPYVINNLIFLSGPGLICPEKQKKQIYEGLQLLQPLYNKIQSFIILQQKLVNEIKSKISQEQTSNFEAKLQLLQVPFTGNEIKNIIPGDLNSEFIINRLNALDKFPVSEIALFETLSESLKLLQPIVEEWEELLASLRQKGQTGGTREKEITILKDGVCELIKPYFFIIESKFNFERRKDLFIKIERTFDILKNNPERFLNEKDIIKELEAESSNIDSPVISNNTVNSIHTFSEKIYNYSSQFYIQKETYQKNVLEKKEIHSKLSTELVLKKQEKKINVSLSKKEKIQQQQNKEFITQKPYFDHVESNNNISYDEINTPILELLSDSDTKEDFSENFIPKIPKKKVNLETNKPEKFLQNINNEESKNYLIETIEGIDDYFTCNSNLDHKEVLNSELLKLGIKNPLFSMAQLDYQKLRVELSDEYIHLMSDRKNPVASQVKFRILSESEDEELLKVWWEAFEVPESWINAYYDSSLYPVKRGSPYYFFKLPDGHPNRKPNDYQEFINGATESGIISRFGEWKNRDGLWMPVVYVTSQENRAVSTPVLLKDFLVRMVLSTRLAGAILRNDTIINTYRYENFIFETDKEICGFFNKNNEYISKGLIREISKTQQNQIKIKLEYKNVKETFTVKELYKSMYSLTDTAVIGILELRPEDNLYYLPENKILKIKRLFINLENKILTELSDGEKKLLLSTKEILVQTRRTVEQVHEGNKLLVKGEKYLLKEEEIQILQILKGFKREQKTEVLVDTPIAIEGNSRTLLTTEEFLQSVFPDIANLSISLNSTNLTSLDGNKRLPENLLVIDQNYISFSKIYSDTQPKPVGDLITPLGMASHFSRGNKDWSYLYSSFNQKIKQSIFRYVLIDGNNALFSEACGKVVKNALATDTSERILKLALHEKIDTTGLRAETLNASLIGLYITEDDLNNSLIADIFHAGNICCFSTNKTGIKDQIPLEQNANGSTNRVSLVNSLGNNNVFSIKENIQKTSVCLDKDDKLFVISNGLELDLEANTDILRVKGLFWPFTIEKLASSLIPLNAITAKKAIELFHMINMNFTKMIRERAGETKTGYIQYSAKDFTEDTVKRKYEAYLDSCCYFQNEVLPFFILFLKLLKSASNKKIVTEYNIENVSALTALTIIKNIYSIKKELQDSEISEEINDFHDFLENLINIYGKKYLQNFLKSLHTINQIIINSECHIIETLYNIITETQSQEFIEKRQDLITKLRKLIKKNIDIYQPIKQYLDTRVNESISIFVFECQRINCKDKIIYDLKDREEVEADRIQGKISPFELQSPEIEIENHWKAKFENKKNIYDLTKTIFHH